MNAHTATTSPSRAGSSSRVEATGVHSTAAIPARRTRAVIGSCRARPASPMKLDDRLRLFLLSFLLLFVELVLIRWTAAHILYLSYFTNFVLLGSFLGIGLGFLRPRERLFRISPLLLAALVAYVYFLP